MSNDACEFLERVKRKQHGFWLTILVLWICVVIFVFLVTELFKDNEALDSIVYVGFYGGAFLTYIPGYGLFRLKCPHCHHPAGALPIFRYRFMYCRSCGERIECCKGATQ
jgi:hypothetical protein